MFAGIEGSGIDNWFLLAEATVIDCWIAAEVPGLAPALAAARAHALGRGVVVADTKFEFGAREGRVLLVDEVLTPDSSRFWPADRYTPGGPQPSFDKQPLRDWLAAERAAGRWDGEAPGPALPAEVVSATSRRYLAAFRQLTGGELPGAPAAAAPAVPPDLQRIRAPGQRASSTSACRPTTVHVTAAR